MTEQEFKKKYGFRDYRARHCSNCKHFKGACSEAWEEERSRRRAHLMPKLIDQCTAPDPPFFVDGGNVCDNWELYKRDYGED